MINGQRPEEIAAARYESEGNIVIRTFKAGCPDLIVFPPEVASSITAAEVKGPGDVERAHQAATIRELKSQNVNAFFLHMPSGSQTSPLIPEPSSLEQIISTIKALRQRNQEKQQADTRTADGGIARVSTIGVRKIMYPCILCGGLAVGRRSKDGEPCAHCQHRGWAKPKVLQAILAVIENSALSKAAIEPHIARSVVRRGASVLFPKTAIGWRRR